MPRHILISTDDPELPRKAVVGILDFAKTLGAHLAAHTCPEEHPYTPFFEIIVEIPQTFKEQVEAQTHVVLKDMEDAAISVGTRCDTDMSCSAAPYMDIIDVTKYHDCNVIFVASYDRRGLAGLLLGSGTREMLTHTEIPAIVYR